MQPKPFDGILRVIEPVRKSVAGSRKRVLPVSTSVGHPDRCVERHMTIPVISAKPASSTVNREMPMVSFLKRSLSGSSAPDDNRISDILVTWLLDPFGSHEQSRPAPAPIRLPVGEAEANRECPPGQVIGPIPAFGNRWTFLLIFPTARWTIGESQ
jgi:hypothetical protein